MELKVSQGPLVSPKTLSLIVIWVASSYPVCTGGNVYLAFRTMENWALEGLMNPLEFKGSALLKVKPIVPRFRPETGPQWQ